MLITLEYDFADLPWLRTLYIHSNYIKDYNELLKLQCLKELKTLTIHGNPLDAYTHFRSLTIGLLPQVVKIDSVLVTKR
jgi:Leucine-rich repeat (LRR) protein